MRGGAETGASVVSALAGVVIVLVLGAIVLSQTVGGGPGHRGASPPSRAGTPSSEPALASAPPAAERAACVADVAAIESAVAAYETLHGAPPPAGTAWATGAGGPLAGQRWPTGSPTFTLAWTGTTVAVTPARGPRAHQSLDGSVGCADL